MAASYITGTNLEEVKDQIYKLEKKNQVSTLDILGEHVLSDYEATIYKDQILRLIDAMPSANISIKLTSICAQLKPQANSSLTRLKDSLRPILRRAQQMGAFINIDIESYDWRDLSYRVIREILLEDEFRAWTNVGTVLQAYLRDSEDELNEWIDWARKRQQPITLRLVKGAYWDYEMAVAEQRRWDSPVWQHKAETDISYEKLSRKLLDASKYLRAAIASHNVRSLAHAIYYANKLGLSKQDYEIQVLYGMVDKLKDHLSREGHSVRVYLPYGELIPGMSYLVRRLLENTANESFLRQDLEGQDLETILDDPHLALPQPSTLSDDACILPAREQENYINVANADLKNPQYRNQLLNALSKVEQIYNGAPVIPLIIAGREITKAKTIESINPATKSLLAQISMAELSDAKDCIEYAAKSQWQLVPLCQRAELLRKVASSIEDRRAWFSALLVTEVAKPWLDADAEVSEAIDFLRYYAKQAEELFDDQRIVSLRGERNSIIYKPYGLAVVIAPWNFPLAILCGMAAASLVAGNSVIIKPSEQSSIIAYELTKLFKQELERKGASTQGLEATVNMLSGSGELIGNYLVEHPSTRLISFTGSETVGRSIAAKATSANVRKQVITEMGGKNAIIIDDTADLDEAIPSIIYSAFGYAGQKCSACSRLIVTAGIYNKLKLRLQEALKGLIIGPASDFDIDLSAVIDAEAYARISNLSSNKTLAPEKGYYVDPRVIEVEDLESPLATEEIFGPVLALIKARDLEDAIQISNSSRYGLTGAIFSRSPANINYARNNIAVGNFYINRGSTGAIVSRQPFGGLKNSSIGYKAGGPNYLLQFVQEQVITENTMRKGFEA